MPKSREEFNNLLEKYLKRQCTLEEERLIDQWYEAIHNTSESDSLEQNSELESKLWEAIDRKTQLRYDSYDEHLTSPKRVSGFQKLIGIAASLLIIVCAGVYTLTKPLSINNATAHVESGASESNNLIIKNTDSKIVKPVRMDDGSLIVLQPGSEIRYKKAFASDNREVTLSGEAFFEIARDEDHPFFVYSQGLVTRVLGTSFNIKAKPGDKTIVVDVKTGKVAVYKESSRVNEKEYFLTPNQQAIYNRDADEIVQQLQENPQVILTESVINEMKFDEAPAVEVFIALEKAYGVDLVYDDQVFSNCFLTTWLSNDGLYEKLQIICKALGATYETRETKVIIHSKGCE
jgi:ferric-dicitrate binding protein FerR (iron transport regulator)